MIDFSWNKASLTWWAVRPRNWKDCLAWIGGALCIFLISFLLGGHEMVDANNQEEALNRQVEALQNSNAVTFGHHQILNRAGMEAVAVGPVLFDKKSRKLFVQAVTGEVIYLSGTEAELELQR